MHCPMRRAIKLSRLHGAIWSLSIDRAINRAMHRTDGKSLASRTKHKIFQFKKMNNTESFMEYRINKLPKKKKTQRSSFKVTTCERFQMVNNTLYRSYVKSGNSLAPRNWPLGAHQNAVVATAYTRFGNLHVVR